MKFWHLSDLHIGKRIYEMSLLKDQAYILEQILEMMAEHRPQAVILAGDIYDKAVPSAEAVALFDGVLTRIADLRIPALIISGNHDSPERLDFASKLMAERQIYMYGNYQGYVQKVVIEAGTEQVNFYLLPFIKPAMVRPFFPDIEIDTYEDAVKAALSTVNLDKSVPNILVTHQFVTFHRNEPEQSDSEAISVGGTDRIDGAIFEDFDYVALGHIHGPQKIGRESLRYCGTPLKYSFSEWNHQKSITVVDISPKEVHIDTLPLKPLRDMRRLKGNLKDILTNHCDEEDYVQVTLTDDYVLDAMGQLRSVYPNTLNIEFDNHRSRAKELQPVNLREKKSVAELFGEFYQQTNGQSMSSEKAEIFNQILKQVGGEEA